MSEQSPDNNNLINFIAATVETLRDQMATKNDLAGLATKSDLTRLEEKADAQFAAVRGDIEQVHLRLDAIERTLRAPRSHGLRNQSPPQRPLPAGQG